MSAQHAKIIYASASRKRRDTRSDRKIFLQSRARNQLFSVTGFLLRTQNRFYQVIEGPKPNVEAIFRSIFADDRHQMIGFWQINDRKDRDFSEWSMGVTTLPKKAQEQMQSAFDDGSINPFEKIEALRYHAVNASRHM